MQIMTPQPGELAKSGTLDWFIFNIVKQIYLGQKKKMVIKTQYGNYLWKYIYSAYNDDILIEVNVEESHGIFAEKM